MPTEAELFGDAPPIKGAPKKKKAPTMVSESDLFGEALDDVGKGLANQRPRPFGVDAPINSDNYDSSSGQYRRMATLGISDTNAPAQPAQSIPEPIDTGGAGFLANLSANWRTTPEGKLQAYAQRLFPDDPSALNRFGIVDGKMGYVDDAGRFVQVEGASMDDRLGRAAAMLPEFIGGTLGAIGGGIGAGPSVPVTGPVGPTAGAIAGGGLGAAFGRSIKQITSNVLLGENQDPQENAQQLAGEAALGATGEVGGRMIAAGARGAFTAADDVLPSFNDLDIPNIQREMRRVRKSKGIQLDAADVTGDASLLRVKDWARARPGKAADVLQELETLKNGQVKDAINGLLDILAKDQDRFLLGRNATNAAEAAIATAKSARAKAVAPMYRAAFDSDQMIDVSNTVEALNEAMRATTGNTAGTLGRVRKWLNSSTDPGTFDPKQSIEELHAVKLELDGLLEAYERRTSNSLTGTAVRKLTQIKSALVSDLSQNAEYDAARQTFADISERVVDPLTDGIIGVLSKVPENKAATISRLLFSGGNVTAPQVRLARRQLANDKAWNGIMRQWLAMQFDAAQAGTQAGAQSAGQKMVVRSFNTPENTDAIKAGLSGAAEKYFDELYDALKFVQQGTVAANSATQPRQVTEGLMSGGATLLEKTRRLAQNPIDTVVNAGASSVRESRASENAMRVAEALTDPEKLRGVAKIARTMKPGTQRTIEIASYLGLTGAGRAAVAQDDLDPSGAALPPILQRQ